MIPFFLKIDSKKIFSAIQRYKIMEEIDYCISLQMQTTISTSFIIFLNLFIFFGLNNLEWNIVSINQVVKKQKRNYQDEVQSKIIAAQQYCVQRGFSTEICFLADMQKHSGEYRFYVYSFSLDSVLHSGLVAHGCGDKLFAKTPVFSNVPGSNCTSLGRYKVGASYYGNYGKAYKLHGLDTSNSNAFKRYVVLHSYIQMPHEETYPLPVMNSQGCPMLSENFMETVSVYIDRSSKPLLLWIY